MFPLFFYLFIYEAHLFIYEALTDNKIEGGQQSLTVLGHRGSGKNRVFSAGDASNARPLETLMTIYKR